jgi:hypothetical protein
MGEEMVGMKKNEDDTREIRKDGDWCCRFHNLLVPSVFTK